MPGIEWSEKLSVKISMFDNEHKKLIDIFNRLHEAMSQGQGQNVLAGIMVELSDYTKNHFSHEENVMKKYGYPGLTEQKKAHEEFIGKLTDAQDQYNNGNVSLSIPMMNFLWSWVQNHIKKMDQNYSEFFIQQGVK